MAEALRREVPTQEPSEPLEPQDSGALTEEQEAREFLGLPLEGELDEVDQQRVKGALELLAERMEAMVRTSDTALDAKAREMLGYESDQELGPDEMTNLARAKNLLLTRMGGR